MNFVSTSAVIHTFDELNKKNIDYILIRNINNELPDELEIGKDIDLLVHYSDRHKIIDCIGALGFLKIGHPFKNDLFLYGANKFEMFKNQDDVLLDFNFQLVCRSLDAGQWIPLDQVIQTSAWNNRRLVDAGGFICWMLSYEDEFVALIVRSIFDKKAFFSGYIHRVNELYPLVDLLKVEESFNLVFFNYTQQLLDQLRDKSYSTIISNYFEFKDY